MNVSKLKVTIKNSTDKEYNYKINQCIEQLLKEV